MHFGYIGIVENSQGERQSRLINKQPHGWTDIAGCRYNKNGSPLASDVTLVSVNTINGEKVFSKELNEPKGKGFHWLRNIDETFIVESYGNGFYSLTGNPNPNEGK